MIDNIEELRSHHLSITATDGGEHQFFDFKELRKERHLAYAKKLEQILHRESIYICLGLTQSQKRTQLNYCEIFL